MPQDLETGEVIKGDIEVSKTTAKEKIDSEMSKVADASDSLTEALKPEDQSFMEMAREMAGDANAYTHATYDKAKEMAGDANAYTHANYDKAKEMAGDANAYTHDKYDKAKEMAGDATAYTCAHMEMAKEKIGDAYVYVKEATVG